MIGDRIQRLVTSAVCAAGWLATMPRRRARRRELGGALKVDRVLVFNDVRGIGNLVLLTALLTNVRRLFPAAEITVAMPAFAAARAILSPALADALVFFDGDPSRRELLRLARYELRPRGFDLGLATYFTPTVLSAAVLLVAGCRYRIAYAETELRGFLNTVTLLDRTGHEVDRHLRLLEPFGKPLERRTVLAATPAPRAGRKGTHGSVRLGVHPGCDGANAAKRWHLDRFTAAIERMIDEEGVEAVVFLGPDDAELLARLRQRLGDRVRVVVGQALPDVIAEIGECDLFLSNDSGLMHVAAALGVPVAAVFGPTDPERSAPIGAAELIFARGVACRPCYTTPPILCPHERRHCLEDVSVDEVVAALRRLASERRAGDRARTPPSAPPKEAFPLRCATAGGR